MFHPTVIQSNLDKLVAASGFVPTPLSVQDSIGRAKELETAIDDKGNQVRQLKRGEATFIQSEILLCRVDYRYWASRYCQINKGGSKIGALFPLLDSQEFILDRVANVELDIFEGRRHDGILINLLKGARQIGGSTLAESIEAHQTTVRTNVFGLIAADVPEQSGYLFDMYERIIDGLPFWMKPQTTEHVKNQEIAFETGSRVWVGSGKSTRGTTGERGQLGRGKTVSVAHLSEISTWEAPDQIDDALLPGIPRSIYTFVMLESTAKGRHNWWHKQWQACEKDLGRFVNIFTPWYVERKYSHPHVPDDWSPSEESVIYAKRVEETSAKWAGRTVRLTKAQLHWFETTRTWYTEKGRLSDFIEEYGAAEPTECFQHSGRSIFTTEVIDRVSRTVSKPLATFDVRRRMEL